MNAGDIAQVMKNLLDKVKENPNFYLGKPSITSLRFFLNGYFYIHRELKSEFTGFQEWIEKREKIIVSQSWAGIVLFGCGSERTAFYRFFELYEQFREEKTPTIERKMKSLNLLELYQLLEAIRKRPGMFLGTKSISNLYMFLKGIDFAKRELNLALTEQEQEFLGLQKWMQQKLGIQPKRSWDRMIIFYSVDEVDALDKFFQLFEEWKNEKNEKQNI
ncbi:MAG: hypothetical protein AAFX80_19860 [Cyanobacteria bacterium J06639_18]